MTTSTLYDLTRIAALPSAGGHAAAMQLEDRQEPAGAAQAREEGQALTRHRLSLLHAAIQRARTAFDHADTALLSMDRKSYITKGQGKASPPKDRKTTPVPVGTRREVKGSTQEWNGTEWVLVVRRGILR